MEVLLITLEIPALESKTVKKLAQLLVNEGATGIHVIQTNEKDICGFASNKVSEEKKLIASADLISNLLATNSLSWKNASTQLKVGRIISYCVTNKDIYEAVHFIHSVPNTTQKKSILDKFELESAIINKAMEIYNQL